jgi:gliding motility-associated-like protein
VDNQASGTYTFTPSAGQCAVATSFTVTVNPVIAPVFGFGSSLTICAGSAVPVLPTTSSNGITGTWASSVADNQHSAIYTFVPTAGQCAASTTFNITVNPNVIPAFSFGNTVDICNGATAPVLPATSANGINGVWSPATVDNQNSGTYTFTPGAGLCAVPTTLSVTVHPIVTPSFGFGPSMTICAGAVVPSLTTTSVNGVSGTWSPSAIDNQQSGTYTFVPAAGQCAISTTLTVTVNPVLTPVFGFGKTFTLCAGANAPQLPTTAANGLTGSWSPASISNQKSGVYTFTPDPVAGKCVNTTTLIVTVNQNVGPLFNFGPTLTICSGTTPLALPVTSANGLTGVWTPSVINNQVSGVYTFTCNAGQCATSTFTLSVTVTPVPTVGAQSDTSVIDGSIVPGHVFTGSPSGVSFNWTNSNTAIGLSASGSGNVPGFTAINKGGNPVKGTVTVTPIFNGCAGTSRNYVITVIPLDKDVFVPNVFSPNGDGKNDILYAYGNYINKLEMHIFNQWGQQIQVITDPHKGWDGRFNGVAQPVGVYVYTLKAVLTDGRTIQLKGNITLVR